MRRSLHTPRRILGALAATGALLAGTLVAAAPATAAPGSPTHVKASDSETGRPTDTAAYWTAERMRAAEPLDLLPAAVGEVTDRIAKGTELLVPPTEAPPGAEAFPESGAPWTGGGQVATTSGRVFFTYDGRQASCSGNAVTSANKSTVLTAGHCVKMDGAWHTDWVFVPGYHDGEAPYGTWTAAKTLSTPQWTASEDINFDVGAAVVEPLDGKQLTDVVGAQGVAFNSGYDKAMYAFGFPAADPYDGTELIHCSGNSTRDVLLTDDHSLGCDMTGGSSGGPWFEEFDESTGTGLQSSVNSFGYTFLPGYMFGPYFGDDAKNLYEEAQTS
ncbi:peptidase [Streptomyces triticagri]|uniref:Peptidase n=1 Tax=Streptomyces triticagri TaxID=2293568 RepID=A0A372M2X3_9ACTN|nr:peptidase [Streptomyces triticagri]RFU85262.1 peptidase [Streptomyces triticagri]